MVQKEDLDADEGLYDLSGLLEIGRGNPGFVEKMVNIFCEQNNKMFNQMIEAHSAGRLEIVRETAHKMKASIDSLNIKRLKPLIQALETAGLDGSGPEVVSRLLTQTESVLTCVFKKLKEEFLLG